MKSSHLEARALRGNGRNASMDATRQWAQRVNGHLARARRPANDSSRERALYVLERVLIRSRRIAVFTRYAYYLLMIDFRHIAIEGLPLSGKTATALALSRKLGSQFVSDVQENPFLEEAIADNEFSAFQTQLFFLIKRFKKDESLRGPELFQHNVVTDYCSSKNKIYAELLLSEEELKLYREVDSLLGSQRIIPNLIIYLQLSEKKAVSRNSKLESSFIKLLQEAYDKFFFSWKYSPVLFVKADEFNPDSDEKIKDLIRVIDKISIQGSTEGIIYYSPIGNEP